MDPLALWGISPSVTPVELPPNVIFAASSGHPYTFKRADIEQQHPRFILARSIKNHVGVIEIDLPAGILESLQNFVQTGEVPDPWEAKNFMKDVHQVELLGHLGIESMPEEEYCSDRDTDEDTFCGCRGRCTCQRNEDSDHDDNWYPPESHLSCEGYDGDDSDDSDDDDIGRNSTVKSALKR